MSIVHDILIHLKWDETVFFSRFIFIFWPLYRSAAIIAGTNLAILYLIGRKLKQFKMLSHFCRKDSFHPFLLVCHRLTSPTKCSGPGWQQTKVICIFASEKVHWGKPWTGWKVQGTLAPLLVFPLFISSRDGSKKTAWGSSGVLNIAWNGKNE